MFKKDVFLARKLASYSSAPYFTITVPVQKLAISSTMARSPKKHCLDPTA